MLLAKRHGIGTIMVEGVRVVEVGNAVGEEYQTSGGTLIGGVGSRGAAAIWGNINARAATPSETRSARHNTAMYAEGQSCIRQLQNR